MNEVQNISELSAKITRLTQDNLTLVQENRTLTDENIRLKHELLYYKRLFYGRRSEKRMPGTPQGELFLCFEGEERLPEETDEIIPIKKEIEIEAHKRRLRKKENREKAKRQPIPADIERRTRVIEPAGVDMEQLEKIGEDVREILHYIPGDFYVDRIVRPVYKLKDQDNTDVSTPVFQASAIETFIPNSYVGSDLLAEIIVGKYIDHLPIYRQLEIFKRRGIKLARSTVNSWTHAAADGLYPLYEEIVKDVLSKDYIQCDESTIPVINNEKHKAVKSYMWALRDPIGKNLFFHYDEGSRAQKVIVSLLRDYRGTVQSDGYDAYGIYENKKGVLLIGCWAHARRKFESARSEDPSLANKALDYIGLLYWVRG